MIVTGRRQGSRLMTGSAGSIGYGIDIAFAKEGANLVITGRNVAKLEAAKESLEAEYGVKVLPVQADTSRLAGITRPSSRTSSTRPLREFGPHDAVNNAQVSASGVTIADHTMDQFNLAIYSGLYATHHLYMQKAYPHLKETKGSVVSFCLGRRPVWQLWPVQLCCRQGGHPRPDPRCRQRGGARTASTSISFARLLGPLRSRTSRMPIPRLSRPTSTCRRQAPRRRRGRRSAAWSFQLCGPDFGT